MKRTPQGADERPRRTLGARLARRRLAKNLTKARLAGEAGIGVRALRRLGGGLNARLSGLGGVRLVHGLTARREAVAPAYDVTFAFNPKGAWTGAHQMTLNGNRDDFVRADFDAFAKASSMKRGRAAAILDEVRAAVARRPEFARAARVDPAAARALAKAHRLELPARRAGRAGPPARNRASLGTSRGGRHVSACEG